MELTRDDILQMKAGSEMEALIGSLVFELNVYSVPKDGKPGFEYKTEKGFFPVRNYSTDIAAAWQVVDKMRDNWNVKITSGNLFPGYRGQEFGCKLDNKSELRVCFSLAETAPLAICRAALLAVMEKHNEQR